MVVRGKLGFLSRKRKERDGKEQDGIDSVKFLDLACEAACYSNPTQSDVAKVVVDRVFH